MFTPLTGRSVVVTGSSKGIGRGIAATFAAAGARVLITGRDADALARTAAEIGGDTSWIVADVGSREDCARMAATAVERHGGVDVLCANAGVFPSARLETMTEAYASVRYGGSVPHADEVARIKEVWNRLERLF